MKIHVLKTDIRTKSSVKSISSFLSDPNIERWSVDMHDADKVLKIVTREDSDEMDFIKLIRSQGFMCETLNY